MHGALRDVLREKGIHPVLLDVGASGAPPRIWRPIARQSVYLGFDADAREMPSGIAAAYYKATIFPQALVENPASKSVPFYLTASPYCSSTLPPDAEALSNHLFAPLFDVVNRVEAPATHISEVLVRAGQTSVDWIKLDTQGTDLRLYMSLAETARSRVLALDVEPGLIDAYRGEDFFIDVHRALTAEGWWLSRANIRGSVRIRRSTTQELEARYGVPPAMIRGAVRVSPGWVEARYFRTIDQLTSSSLEVREYVLAWCFAMLDGQFGHAFDCAVELQRRFGDALAGELQQLTIRKLRRGRISNVRDHVRRLLPPRAERLLRRLMTR